VDVYLPALRRPRKAPKSCRRIASERLCLVREVDEVTIAQRFSAGFVKEDEGSPRSGRLINLSVRFIFDSAVRFTDYVCSLTPIPTDESVGYYHPSTSPTFQAKPPSVGPNRAVRRGCLYGRSERNLRIAIDSFPARGLDGRAMISVLNRGER
jgi:hypothetical protein